MVRVSRFTLPLLLAAACLGLLLGPLVPDGGGGCGGIRPARAQSRRRTRSEEEKKNYLDYMARKERLWWAAHENDIPAAQKALDEGADINDFYVSPNNFPACAHSRHLQYSRARIHSIFSR